MAKKLETKLLITSLKKAAKETGKNLWEDLADRLEVPSRNRISVNVEKINSLAEKNKGKVILVPGKVLSSGDLTEKVTVVAISASENARAKINAKGKFILLKEYAKEAGKAKVSDVIIAK